MRRLIIHIALAGIVWLCAVLLLETLLPGSVTPFVNVVQWALGIVCLCAIAAGTSEPSGIAGTIVSMGILVICVPILLLIAWRSVRDEGISGMVVFCIIVLSIIYFGVALFRPRKP